MVVDWVSSLSIFTSLAENPRALRSSRCLPPLVLPSSGPTRRYKLGRGFCGAVVALCAACQDFPGLGMLGDLTRVLPLFFGRTKLLGDFFNDTH